MYKRQICSSHWLKCSLLLTVTMGSWAVGIHKATVGHQEGAEIHKVTMHNQEGAGIH